MCILDLSKTFMYDFYCNYPKKNVATNLNYCIQKTLVWYIKLKQIETCKSFYTNGDMFDFGEYLDKAKFCDAKIKRESVKRKIKLKMILLRCS